MLQVRSAAYFFHITEYQAFDMKILWNAMRRLGEYQAVVNIAL